VTRWVGVKIIGVALIALFPRPERPLQLILFYVVFMVTGDLLAYGIGYAVESAFGSRASFAVFLALYFIFLWVAWLLAVRVTEPSVSEPATSG
jgi:hypothetical membrane protein